MRRKYNKSLQHEYLFNIYFWKFSTHFDASSEGKLKLFLLKSKFWARHDTLDAKNTAKWFPAPFSFVKQRSEKVLGLTLAFLSGWLLFKESKA